MATTLNTPGTRVGPDGHDRTLAPKWVKSNRRKRSEKKTAEKYFPKVGQKTEEKKRKKKKKTKVGDNNGQDTHGARKHAWRTQAIWAKNTEKNLRSASGLFHH